MYTHITRDDRIVISDGLRRNESYAIIGSRISKDKSAVFYEVRRNADPDGAYDARRADTRSRKRRRESKYSARKIENDPLLAAFIESRLEPLVSPEVVAHEACIAHETIYAWLERSRPDLKKKLPHRNRKRRRYGLKRAIKQGWTRSVRSIDERVRKDENWEGDTIKGSTRSRVLTHVEDESLFTVADLMPDGTADSVHAKTKKRSFFGTITYDRGSEFALWRMIERDTHATVYFAHAHHPWERGKNENTNGRLRRVFPKGFDFSTIKQRDLDAVVEKMNHTPRKSLLWRTPCAVYGKCCASR